MLFVNSCRGNFSSGRKSIIAPKMLKANKQPTEQILEEEACLVANVTAETTTIHSCLPIWSYTLARGFFFVCMVEKKKNMLTFRLKIVNFSEWWNQEDSSVLSTKIAFLAQSSSSSHHLIRSYNRYKLHAVFCICILIYNQCKLHAGL